MKKWIKTLTTDDGHLRNVQIEFAEGLTCVIGARGTCKSTIIETIRFVHNLGPSGVSESTDSDPLHAKGPAGLLQATLASGTAECTVQTADDETRPVELRIERSIDMKQPRIHRDGVLDTNAQAIEVPLEIYSQGDLAKIAGNPQYRLQLVDRPHAGQLGTIKARLKTTQKEIAKLGEEILALRAALREDARGLSQLPELEAQLQVVQRERPALDARLESARAEHEMRQQLLVTARTGLGTFQAYFALPSTQVTSSPPDETLSQALEQTGLDHAMRLAEDFRTLSSESHRLEAQLVLSRKRIQDATITLKRLEAAFDERDLQYRKLRRDQEDLSASLEKEDRIRAQLRRLTQLSETLDQRKSHLDSRVAHRSELRSAVEGYIDEAFQLRVGEVEKITTDLGDDIALAVVQGAQSGAYTEAIADLLQGTRLKRQRDIAARISELLTPAELVTLVEQESSSQLALLASLDDSQASRIINHFQDNMSRVLKLETLSFDDHLEITMNVDGEVRPVEQLSKGQMATALLPLILRHADYPLVFDQPEDDLDNRFIFDELVTKIRTLKRARQLIFVTHNANIPVLGDADRVIVMSMATARLADTPLTGSVDEMRTSILDILEGGATAFRERRNRYKGIL